jgi:hypothetical protein
VRHVGLLVFDNVCVRVASDRRPCAVRLGRVRATAKAATRASSGCGVRGLAKSDTSLRRRDHPIVPWRFWPGQARMYRLSPLGPGNRRAGCRAVRPS